MVSTDPRGVYWFMSKPKLVIAGASGVVGRHLVAAAKNRYDVTVLTRTVEGDEPAGARAVAWNPQALKAGDVGGLEALANVLSGAHALVNLAGASIGSGRLNDEQKRKVLQSRVDSTKTLGAALERAAEPPPVWFQASAVGYYGDRGDEVLTEASSPQDGFFLSRVCQAWEDAAKSVVDKTRLVTGRFGLVLAKDAAAWQQFLLPVKLFIGGPLGSGQQWYAWIDADDLAKGVLFLIEDDAARGVYNFTAPNPVRQAEFTERAAQRLSRPALVPAPAFALKLVLGDLAVALLLPSARALPVRLEAAGFSFEYATLDAELTKLLG